VAEQHLRVIDYKTTESVQENNNRSIYYNNLRNNMLRSINWKTIIHTSSLLIVMGLATYFRQPYLLL
jgi:hypothetical protein